MPRRKTTRTKSAEETTFLAIRVELYQARTDAAVNHNVYAPGLAWEYDEDDPLYLFGTDLTIFGSATWPEKRAGETFELTIYGADGRTTRRNATLRDVQRRDAHGSRQYRSYRGREIPVFDPPGGMGHLDKVRGQRSWTGAIFTHARFVTDALVLLGQSRPLYVSLDERKRERTRWIRSLTFQTTDPAEE